MSDLLNKPELTYEEIRQLKEMAQSEIRKKHKTAVKTTGYILGSVALFAVAAKYIPKTLDTLSAKLYRHSIKNDLEDEDDDWGPEIVRKTVNRED